MKKNRIIIAILVGIGITFGAKGRSQQINIQRIDRMPNKPSPYLMRDWKRVALGYDSLIFDLFQTGDHLPLVWTDGFGINYPNHDRFGLDSYVGTPHSKQAEAINVIPAVVGATLVDIDKSNQNGINWVLMCEEFFNRRPAENVYLNGFTASSGSDWWYETMPNIFFYQLAHLYPHTGGFDYQFTMVADRWLEAVQAMGGEATPWRHAYMDYRAWALSTMTPLDVGVKEPEAAGAIGWILFNAYRETGDEKYRMGAEWCLEYLDIRNQNPSYELQLPYGVTIAARMNAELGTDYDVEKMVNWCFDPGQNVRNWGATLGKWGDYDCDGLIGEAKYTGYAFAMNGFEQVGALVPMVRYDDRFARAIGKWVLNCANASRLFYTNYLPDEHQDSESWSHQYDPNSTIAHEALREYDSSTGKVISPYATGDAIRGGWAATNLALYGASHVGIFGGTIETTNVDMILQLDVLKTDYYGNVAYPTYLYYNPHVSAQTVEIFVGEGFHDLYDAVSNTFLETGVAGTASFTVTADAAVLLVVVPSGGTIMVDLDMMFIDGIVVDYRSGQVVPNYPPRIKGLAPGDAAVVKGNSMIVYCTAEDRDEDPLTYEWNGTGGSFSGTGDEGIWDAPEETGPYILSCVVHDGNGGQDSALVTVEVVEFINNAPAIDSLVTGSRRLHPGASTDLLCYASDPDGDVLSYVWDAEAGSLESEDSAAVWTAPMVEGFYYTACTVDDGLGGFATDSVGIMVQDTSDVTMGDPIVYFPFNGNASDESGFDHHGEVKGALLTEDRFGNPNSAYSFNGSFDLIQVPNHPQLNFQDAITVSLWMKPENLFTYRESYPISHGNWENRWKISIIPQKKIRWTVNTNRGIKDLDSQIVLQENTYYHVVALFDGSNVDLYVNGLLDNRTNFSGAIMTTTHDLTIGQHLPDNPGYNFKGVLDEIRIYDYPLSLSEILALYDAFTDVLGTQISTLPDHTRLLRSYPNPFNATTTIPYQLSEPGHVFIRVFNMRGQIVNTLIDADQPAGFYSVIWDGTNHTGENVASGIYLYEMETENYRDIHRLLILK